MDPVDVEHDVLDDTTHRRGKSNRGSLAVEDGEHLGEVVEITVVERQEEWVRGQRVAGRDRPDEVVAADDGVMPLDVGDLFLEELRVQPADRGNRE